MRTRYSKPSGDIFSETERLIRLDNELFERQKKALKKLISCPKREKCLLCENPVKGKEFSHRDILYICCSTCGHIQTRLLPPEGYPSSVSGAVTFNAVYPDLSEEDYAKRASLIYKPKLQWAVESMEALGYDKKEIRSRRWTEIGCGAGYFLSVCREFGIESLTGLDSDEVLVNQAKRHLGSVVAQLFSGGIHEIIDRYPSDIYVAFFVLEHIENPFLFFDRLRDLPEGTIFVFSVPVYGFSSVLEQIFDKNWARNLNGEIHSQLYTDRSIKYALDRAGFEIAAEWIFGQDASDMYRFITLNGRSGFAERFMHRTESEITDLIDVFQGSLDMKRMSDQRHVVAVKRQIEKTL